MNGNNNALAKNLEKLSSGYRINKAGDDAAGLAISEKMRAQIRGLETAQKNAQDGISLIQTAEGALTEVHSMLNRMVELATQSSNGIYDNDVDRDNLNKEFQTLKSEIDRVSKATNFNGRNLLDGSLSKSGATAYSVTGSRIIDYDNPTYTSTENAFTSLLTGIDYAEKDVFTIDGTEITVDWTALDPEVQAELLTDFTGHTATAEVKEKIAQGIQDAINRAIDASGTGVAHVTVGYSGDNLTFTSGSNTGESEVTMTTAGTNSVGAKVFGAAGTGAAAKDQEVGFSLTNGVSTMYVNIGSGQVTVDAFTTITADSSDMQDVIDSLQAALDQAVTKYNAGNSGSLAAGSASLEAKVGKDGNIEIINKTGMDISFGNFGDSNVAERLGLDKTTANSAGGGLTLQVGDTSAEFNKVTVNVGDMSSKGLKISSTAIGTEASASKSIDVIKAAINTVSSTRGDLGALQNRLEHTINNLGVTTENMTAAESRIRDTDMAKEMMAYTKNNILVQAAQAMLAQANTLPQGVLQLLR